MEIRIEYIFFTAFLVVLGPALALIVKKKNFSLQKSLRYFIFLTVLRISTLLAYSYYLHMNAVSLFPFLLTFTVVYSILLIPEVMLIARIMDGKATRR